ncbi:NHLP-related RiPP peptide [Xanthomonas campestris pv. phormiicola]|nr:NHLP-related RiPP peptide [Xanthomonas campestris pv. phormiicola]
MATKKTGDGNAALLDLKVASRLLDLLATDNDFRKLFKKDPRAALVTAGYRQDAEELDRLSECCKVHRIAPKRHIIKSREALLELMTSGMSQNPIHLNIESNAPRRPRKP